jgi:hypothetical protein
VDHQRQLRSEPDANPNSYANTDPDSHSDGYSDPDPNADPDSNRYANPNTDPDSNSYANPDRDLRSGMGGEHCLCSRGAGELQRRELPVPADPHVDNGMGTSECAGTVEVSRHLPVVLGK